MTSRPSIWHDLKQLLTLAWPVVVSRIGFMTMGLIDTVVVGRYSTMQLGFHALAWAVSGVVLTTGMGLVSGVQVKTAQYLGEGRLGATGGVLRRGVVYGFWLGLAFAVIFGFGAKALLRGLGLDEALVVGAAPVLVVFALSFPFYMTEAAASVYLEALSRPRVVMAAVLACNLLNLFLDLVLVPGRFGIPALGAAGAAWGTFGARLVMLIWLAAAIVLQKDARLLGLFAPPLDGRLAAIEQRRIGYGAGVSLFVESAAFAGLSIIAGWLGGLAVAGWGILLNLSALVFMLPMGLATATGVLVGRAYGARDAEGVRRFGFLGFGLGAATQTVIALAVLCMPGLIAGVFTPDPALRQLVQMGLLLCCLFFVADGLQVIGSNALRAQSDIVIPTVTHTVSYCLVMCPLAWWLAIPLGFGLPGTLWAVVTASLLAACLLMGRFYLLTRRAL